MIEKFETYIKKCCCNDEDLIQETYLELLLKRKEEITKSDVYYAIKEARRKLTPLSRSVYKKIGKIEMVEYSDNLIQEECQLSLEEDILSTMKKILKDYEFNMIYDCYWNKLSFSEISAKYKLERFKVKSLIRRAKTKLSRNKKLYELFKDMI